MKPFESRLVCILGAFWVAGTVQVLAEAKPNPYQAIIERNPFALKAPPPLVQTSAPPAVVPLGKVVLTGITSWGPAPKALLEITEQEPGKTANIRRPILQEGERDGSVEVLSIDIEKSLVKIRNAGNETSITFETPKIAASGAAPAPAAPSFPPPPVTASTPTVISPANAAANNLGRASSVTVVGGGSAEPASVGAPVAPATSAPSLNAGAGGFGASGMPSRPLRSDGASSEADDISKFVQWHVLHEAHTQQGLLFPPPPPIKGINTE